MRSPKTRLLVCVFVSHPQCCTSSARVRSGFCTWCATKRTERRFDLQGSSRRDIGAGLAAHRAWVRRGQAWLLVQTTRRQTLKKTLARNGWKKMKSCRASCRSRAVDFPGFTSEATRWTHCPRRCAGPHAHRIRPHVAKSARQNNEVTKPIRMPNLNTATIIQAKN
eukprot:Rmarinus@m.10141